MSDIIVTHDQIAAVFKQKETERADQVDRAVLESALQGENVIAKAAPVDMGILKNSVRTEKAGKNVEVSVNAPHAAVLEIGSRPHMPPLDPIKEWARRHGLDEKIAGAIWMHIRRYGTKPRWFVRNSLPKLRKILEETVGKAISR